MLERETSASYGTYRAFASSTVHKYLISTPQSEGIPGYDHLRRDERTVHTDGVTPPRSNWTGKA